MTKQITDFKLAELFEKYPYVIDFFNALSLQEMPKELSVAEIVATLPYQYFEDYGFNDAQQLIERFQEFILKMEQLKVATLPKVATVTIIGGHDKVGLPECCRLVLRPGEVVCIVGPTGSGKSRLLADIESMAQGDTPTGRQILINDNKPDSTQRFSLEHKLVAQLSQNMNFVVDLSVAEFVAMHAESRMVPNIPAIVATVITCANELAGEQFTPETSLTQLSGGQSRALMIADTALLSVSPIVLIDEIENAGVDRKKALDLLIGKEKIVLMSTHDPILALLGQKRIVIKNGGIERVIETGTMERWNLKTLEEIDQKMLELRNRLRGGEMIDLDIRSYFGMA